MAPQPSLVDLKTKMCTEYLKLSQSMQTTAHAMQDYVRALASQPSHEDTVKLLVPIPGLPSFLDLGNGASVDLDAVLGSSANGKKRGRKSEGADGKKKEKKPKDPNAPKRPASAYLQFQNNMRQNMKGQNHGMDNKALLAHISEAWKGLSETDKKKWEDGAKKQMESWKVENAAYEAEKQAKASGASPEAAAAIAVDEQSEDESEEEEEEKPAAKKLKTVAAPAAKAESSSSDSDDSNADDSSDEEPPKPAPKSSKAKSSAVNTPVASKKSSKTKSK